MFDLSLPKLLILAVLALVVFGPNELPKIASQAGRFLRDLRRIAEGAQADLREGLGPEFADFDVSDLHPRNFVTKHLLSDPDDATPDDPAPDDTAPDGRPSDRPEGPDGPDGPGGPDGPEGPDPEGPDGPEGLGPKGPAPDAGPQDGPGGPGAQAAVPFLEQVEVGLVAQFAQ